MQLIQLLQIEIIIIEIIEDNKLCYSLTVLGCVVQKYIFELRNAQLY